MTTRTLKDSRRNRQGGPTNLTITRQFLRPMGGTLLVESEVSRGSRFVVELPLELATESETYSVETGVVSDNQNAPFRLA
jgi:signal transduction histidine kinase